MVYPDLLKKFKYLGIYHAICDGCVVILIKNMNRYHHSNVHLYVIFLILKS